MLGVQAGVISGRSFRSLVDSRTRSFALRPLPLLSSLARLRPLDSVRRLMSTLHNHHFVGAGSRTQLLPAAGPRSRGLERWMRERNFRAQFPSSTKSEWPPPEGEAEQPEVHPCSECISERLDRDLSSANPTRYLSDTLNAVKTHRCMQSYCLRCLRGQDLRECAKGGFGLEAPLVGHMLEGLMAPKRAGGDEPDAAPL